MRHAHHILLAFLVQSQAVLASLQQHVAAAYTALLPVPQLKTGSPVGKGGAALPPGVGVGHRSMRSKVSFSAGTPDGPVGSSPLTSPAPPRDTPSPAAAGRSPALGGGGRRLTAASTPGRPGSAGSFGVATGDSGLSSDAAAGGDSGGITRKESFRAISRSSSRMAIEAIKDKYLDKYRSRSLSSRHRRTRSSAGARGGGPGAGTAAGGGDGPLGGSGFSTEGFASGSFSLSESGPMSTTLPEMRGGAGGVTTSEFAQVAKAAVEAAKAGQAPPGIQAPPPSPASGAEGGGATPLASPASAKHMDVLAKARGTLQRTASRSGSGKRGGALASARGAGRALQHDEDYLDLSPGPEGGGLVDVQVEDEDDGASGSAQPTSRAASSASTASTATMEGGDDEEVEDAVIRRAASMSQRTRRESLKLPEQEEGGGGDILAKSADLLRRSSLSFRKKAGLSPPAEGAGEEGGAPTPAPATEPGS